MATKKCLEERIQMRNTFANRLRSIGKDYGFSQDKLAEFMEVDKQTAYDYLRVIEEGHKQYPWLRQPQWEALFNLYQAIKDEGVSLEYLMCVSDSPNEVASKIYQATGLSNNSIVAITKLKEQEAELLSNASHSFAVFEWLVNNETFTSLYLQLVKTAILAQTEEGAELDASKFQLHNMLTAFSQSLIKSSDKILPSKK